MRRVRFTLIELIAVMAIVGILAGITLGVSSAVRSRIALSKTEALFKQLEVALEHVKAKHGFYPPSMADNAFYLNLKDLSLPAKYLSDFQSCLDLEKMARSADVSSFADYLSDAQPLKDGYHRNIRYVCPGTHNTDSYDLESGGPDGDLTTEQDNIANFKY